MSRVGWNARQSTFVLFIPKWTQVQRPDEIQKILAQQTTSQLLTFFASTAAKPSLLAQKVYVNSSDNKSIQSSEDEE